MGREERSQQGQRTDPRRPYEQADGGGIGRTVAPLSDELLDVQALGHWHGLHPPPALSSTVVEGTPKTLGGLHTSVPVEEQQLLRLSSLYCCLVPRR